MDPITMEELKTFLPRRPGWHVSLFMPTHRTGRGTEQDPIRLKNLLGKAEKRLLAKGLRSPDVKKMLKPAQGLLQDRKFWQNQSHGLAVLLTSEEFHSYRLPLPFEELVIVSHSFHLKPLLPFLASDGHFYILTLSQNHVRLLEGTRHTVDEIDLEKMPRSMVEAFHFDSFDRQMQSHSGSSPRAGSRSTIFHGHSASDEDKDRILRWFRRIDEELPNLFIGEQSPMVLAGVKFLFSLYKTANTYPHLVDKGIAGSPEELSPEELHARAWELVQPIFMQAQEKAAARYKQLADKDQATADVKEAILAAQHGQVEALFVALGVQVWGKFDKDTNTIHIREESQPGDEDLLDLAAIQTILKGGTVYALEPEKMPGQGSLAAVFRY